MIRGVGIGRCRAAAQPGTDPTRRGVYHPTDRRDQGDPHPGARPLPFPQPILKPRSAAIALGLEANRGQFWLLVLVSAFVGAMVGLERTVLPLLAEAEFGVASRSAALSFIAAFGTVKALTNLLAGHLADRYGRRPVLCVGWLFALPVPFLVIWAPEWHWVVIANVFLGINQGLTWSTTVMMKIDLVGPRQRGLAMGLNEFAGYIAVALAAFATGVLAEQYGLRPAPFYLGVVVAVAGLLSSILFVQETRGHVQLESGSAGVKRGVDRHLGHLLVDSVWRDRALATSSHVGLVNNLNDGLAWGLFPILFFGAGLSLRDVGWLTFVYPATWGVTQVATGPLSDRFGRRPLIVSGMLLQGIALAGIALSAGFARWLPFLMMLGLGTAMVYPALLAAVGDSTPPARRGAAIGVYRLWRDGGYVVGALLAGALADRFGLAAAIFWVGVLTIAAGLLALVRLPETRGADSG